MRRQDYSGPWPWTYFQPHEIACKHCGELWPGDEQEAPMWFEQALDALDNLRADWGSPIILNSAHRCEAHNRAVGGAKSSQHLLRVAFDCRCPAEDQDDFIRLALANGFTGIGRYPRRGFVHLDLGPKREWRG